MREYPHTSKEFLINGKNHRMKKFTLLMLSHIEDENIYVSFRNAVEQCTDISEVDMDGLSDDQFRDIYEHISEFSKPDDVSESEEELKALDVIAILMNRGHMDAQYYRIDFVEVVVKHLTGTVKDSEEKDDDDNEAKMKELFG